MNIKITIKNWIGGILLITAVMIYQEYNLGWWLILMELPAWIILFNWNE